jgi:hypothetical protein
VLTKIRTIVTNIRSRVTPKITSRAATEIRSRVTNIRSRVAAKIKSRVATEIRSRAATKIRSRVVATYQLGGRSR